MLITRANDGYLAAAQGFRCIAMHWKRDPATDSARPMHGHTSGRIDPGRTVVVGSRHEHLAEIWRQDPDPLPTCPRDRQPWPGPSALAARPELAVPGVTEARH